jgi:hypothetical protein
MQIQISAASRLKAAAPGQLFSKIQKVLGKNFDTKKKGKEQVVTWHLGMGRRSTSLVLTYNTATDDTSIEYLGYNGDVIEVKDKDENKAWKKFKKQVDDWLTSGEATPEDRNQIEPLLNIK